MIDNVAIRFTRQTARALTKEYGGKEAVKNAIKYLNDSLTPETVSKISEEWNIPKYFEKYPEKLAKLEDLKKGFLKTGRKLLIFPKAKRKVSIEFIDKDNMAMNGDRVKCFGNLIKTQILSNGKSNYPEVFSAFMRSIIETLIS